MDTELNCINNIYIEMPVHTFQGDLTNGTMLIKAIILDMEQKEVPVNVLIDTGANSGICSPDIFSKIKSKEITRIATKSVGEKEAKETIIYNSVSLKFDFSPYYNTLEFVTKEIPHPRIDVVIGTWFLQKFSLLYNSPMGKFSISTHHNTYSAKKIE